MLYRGMALWPFVLYPLFYISVVFLLAIVVSALGGDVGSESDADPLMQLAIILFSSVLTGLYGNALLHRHVKKAVAKSSRLELSDEKRKIWLTRKGKGHASAVVVLLFLIFVIGILAAVAVPAYQDYTVRAKLLEAFAVGAEVKAAFTEHYVTHGELPTAMQDIGYTETPVVRGVYTADLYDMEGLTVVGVDVSALLGGSGQYLILTPTVDTNSRVITWTCSALEVPEKYLPSSCK